MRCLRQCHAVSKPVSYTHLMVELAVSRLSNYSDYIPLMVSERLIDTEQDYTGQFIRISGQFRSYNRHEEKKNRLVLSVFVRELEFLDEIDENEKTNQIFLDGYICKEPIYRKTPLGREIADVLLAVNRSYGKSDYIDVYKRQFFFCLFFMLAVMNPIFIHSGETILFFMNDNPVTLEALIYGTVSAGMLVGVLLWCKCYTTILTTDKFLYLFGKIIPKMGLILSMVFRFIPLFKLQIHKINQAQKTMGLYATDSIPDKIGGGMRVFDSLLAWSMENSIDTADSMKARG